MSKKEALDIFETAGDFLADSQAELTTLLAQLLVDCAFDPDDKERSQINALLIIGMRFAETCIELERVSKALRAGERVGPPDRIGYTIQ
jgi:hypothetical protein